MSRRALLFLSFLSLIFSSFCQFSCPLSQSTFFNPSTSTKNFNSFSQQVILTKCTQYSNDTCCTKHYDELIGSNSDLFRTTFESKFQGASTTCSTFLSRLPCVLCSPHQSVFFYSTSRGVHLRVCKSFCDKLYSHCKSETETQEAEDFCSNFLKSDQIVIDVLPNEEGCYTTVKPECTDDEYAEEYGPCDDRNMRKLFYGLEAESDCIGVVNRDPIENLPCNISCLPGHYLPMGKTSCSSCQAGSFSVGSGTRIEEWNSWPAEFETKTNLINEKNITTPLPGWKYTGDVITTLKINDSQSAVLSMTVKLIEDGYVRFQYKVNSEPVYDGLLFEVDGISLTPQIISSVLNFQYMKFNLTKGIHTLTWKYVKDYSFSMGDDAATIRVLEIHGTKFANDECTLCPPGKYSSHPRSSYCTLCPVNTFSNGHGSTICTPCKDDEYSYLGSTNCTKRRACTDDDYYSEFTPCRLNPNNEPKRDIVYDWKDPLLCNYKAFNLPENKTDLDCAACNPGTHRVGATCEYCPVGSMNEGGPENEDKQCIVCPAGTAAIPSLVLDRFDRLPSESTSNCDGDCAVSEWQIYDDYMDSGVGHGTWVDIYFLLNVTMDQPGVIRFEADMECHSSCRLQYVDFGYYAEVFTRGPISYEAKLTKGFHTLQWNFNKYDPSNTDPTAKATISKISVIGTESGGAFACTPCTAGTFSSKGSPYCTNCPAGSSNNQDFTACEACRANTYNRKDGGTCIPCGPGVQTPPGSTDCNGGCSFVDGRHTYNLSSLKSPWMIGPLIGDTDESWFYFSVCQRVALNQTNCYDYNGDPTSVLACSLSSLDPPIGCSLGDVMGFYPHTTEKGVIMTIGGGDCGGSSGTQVNITFVCDPLQGMGYPELDDPPAATRLPADFFKHNFEWRTVFACPACTEKDYAVFYTSCQNNHRTKTYAWNDNPRHCFGGVDLPIDEEVPCEPTSTSCDPGSYYALEVGGCVLVPAGDFSVGGEIFDSWDPNDANQFEHKIPENCTSCSPWERVHKHVQSGKLSSSLEIVRNFIKEGKVYFEYRLFSPGSYGFDDFSMSIGDTDVFEVQGPGNLTWIPVTVNVPKGTHILSWEYESSLGDSPGRPEGVSIRKIILYGTADASVNTKHCPAGTFSETAGSTSCQICPANTQSDSASTHCTPCRPKFFSQPGSASCESSLSCKRSEYAKLYSACNHNSRSARWVALEPKICVDPEEPVIPTLPASEPCNSCPDGFIRDQDTWQCTPCSKGHYLADDGKCAIALEGSYAPKVRRYWIDNSDDSWPAGWSTVCYGACGSNGWRILGTEIESGYHQYNEVDSSVSLVAELEMNGKIEFEYLVSGTSVGLQFFVDGVPQTMRFSSLPTEEYTKVSFDISKGKKELTWNYYQPIEFNGYAKLRNVIITGDITGSASKMIDCPIGYYGDKRGQVECQPCPAGTYNPQKGSVQCQTCPVGEFSIAGSSKCFPCGRGTVPSADHTTCSTTCIFKNDYNDTFDLSAFSKKKMMSYSSITNQLYTYNFCNKLEKGDSECQAGETYFCALSADDTSKGEEMGRLLNFMPNVAHNGTYSADKKTSFTLVYTLGSNKKCSSISTTFDFICEPDVKNSKIVELPSSTKCAIHFEYSLPAACRACEAWDYKEVKSFCSNDAMTIKNIKTNPNCYGEEVKDIREAQCSSSFQLSTTGIGIVVAIAVLVAVLFGALIFVYLSNRKMEIEYEKLVTKKDDKEEKEMEDLSP